MRSTVLSGIANYMQAICSSYNSSPTLQASSLQYSSCLRILQLHRLPAKVSKAVKYRFSITTDMCTTYPSGFTFIVSVFEDFKHWMPCASPLETKVTNLLIESTRSHNHSVDGSHVHQPKVHSLSHTVLVKIVHASTYSRYVSTNYASCSEKDQPGIFQ